MTSKTPFYIVVFLLVVVGFSHTLYRHFVYNVPLLPGETKQVWDVEAQITFTATDKPVKVSLAIPSSQDSFNLISESASSPGYGIAYEQSTDGRRAEWTKRSAAGQQSIYYKTQFLVDANKETPVVPPEQTQIKPQIPFSGPALVAAQTLLSEAHQRSADSSSLTRQLIQELNDVQSQSAQLLLDQHTPQQTLAVMLDMAKVPNRIVGVLRLEDARRKQKLVNMNQVWDGEKWRLFDTSATSEQQNMPLLVWNQSVTSLLDVDGGEDSHVRFSMIQRPIAATQATRYKTQSDELLNLSIHSLPLEEQAMFKPIMLIPIGALIVVALRILIGLKTSGTFMPVLIAVAFVQTQLLTGIIGFLLIVGTGLLIRSYLSRLNLLLVARISSVIISVILIIALFTVLAFKLGITEGLTITFFPMIILSWTIERMSILWEEEGPKEVLLQGGGSLLTAILVYLAMTNSIVQHLTFNFIGLQLVLLAGILLLGTYTGYRLSELQRFTPMVEK